MATNNTGFIGSDAGGWRPANQARSVAGTPATNSSPALNYSSRGYSAPGTKTYGGLVPSSGVSSGPSFGGTQEQQYAATLAYNQSGANSAARPSGGSVTLPKSSSSGGTSGSGSTYSSPSTGTTTAPRQTGGPSAYISSPKTDSTGLKTPGSSSSSSSSSGTSGMTNTTSSSTTKEGVTTTKESTEPKPFLDFDKMFEYQKRINNELDLPMLRETNQEGYKYRSMEANDSAGRESVARREASGLAMQRDVLSSDLERGTMRQQQALQTRTKDQDLARALSTVMGRRK